MGYITHISTSVSKLEDSHFKLGVDIRVSIALFYTLQETHRYNIHYNMKQIELHYSEQNFHQHEIAYHFHILLKILVS